MKYKFVLLLALAALLILFSCEGSNNSRGGGSNNSKDYLGTWENTHNSNKLKLHITESGAYFHVKRDNLPKSEMGLPSMGTTDGWDAEYKNGSLVEVNGAGRVISLNESGLLSDGKIFIKPNPNAGNEFVGNWSGEVYEGNQMDVIIKKDGEKFLIQYGTWGSGNFQGVSISVAYPFTYEPLSKNSGKLQGKMRYESGGPDDPPSNKNESASLTLENGQISFMWRGAGAPIILSKAK